MMSTHRHIQVSPQSGLTWIVHPASPRARPWYRIQALVLLVVFWGGVIPADAGTTVWTGAHSFRVGVTSMTERRWERVIRQQYDFSCGSAAVATLLNYHYGIPRTEAQVFEAMYQQGDQAQIRAEGFSMLDLKQYLDAHDLRSDGFRMSLEQLAEIGVPAIALVSTNGYRHFVVVKGIRGNEVVVGDPAGGAAIIPVSLMEEIWNGILLAARAQQDVARQNFNHPADWAIRPDAPLGAARHSATMPVRGLNLPGINEFGR